MANGHGFLDKVLSIVREESSDDTPLIQFVHPKELEKILDLDMTKGVNDAELEKCIRNILQHSVKTNRATFRNQLFGAMDPYGLAGAWITEAFNTSQYTFEVSPAFTLIENRVIQHSLRLFGLSGDGVFSPGGSMAIFYGLTAARFSAFPEVKTKGMRGLPELVIFTSIDSHYSIKKAAHWLGFGTDSIRLIGTNHLGQMDTEELDATIQSEKDAGRCPLFVNATAGTTVLGAIDNLDAVADICQKHDVWMHVDACWGGSLILSEKYRSKLKGIERAQSLSWNPHKMAGAPLQCSLVLCARPGLLHAANCAAAKYLFHQDKFYDVSYDTGDKSVQCGRKIDSFKLWVMWKARGDAGLGALVDHAMDIASFAMETVASRPGFRLVTDTLQCPNVCFWYIPGFMRDRNEDEDWWETIHKITPKIKELLMLSSKLMISYSPVRGHRNFFRLAVTCHPRLRTEQVTDMLDAIQECGETLTQDML